MGSQMVKMQDRIEELEAPRPNLEQRSGKAAMSSFMRTQDVRPDSREQD